MYDLKNMLCDELDEIARKGELSTGDLDVVDKLTHSIKSLVTIMAMDEGGYSGARRRDSMGRYADGRYYDDGENDGGYSGRRYYERRYSRDEGKSHMTHQLEKMMEEATTREEREAIQSALGKLKNM